MLLLITQQDALYKIFTHFLWSIAFAASSVFPITYEVIGNNIISFGLDMPGYLEKNGIEFQNVEHIVYIFAMQFLILKFVKKLVDVYALQVDGDASADIVTLVINFCKAMVIAICFTVIWSWIYDIAYDFTQQIIHAVPIHTKPSEILRQLRDSTSERTNDFSFVICPIIIVVYGILMLVQLKNGLDLWILRIGMPLACVGLMDSDQGVFKQYCRLILKCILTLVVQMFCVNAGLYVLSLAGQTDNKYIFYIISIAMVITGFTTPKILSELLVPQNQGTGGKVMQAVYMGSMLLRGVM